MGPAPTSPRALHGWTSEALSCSSRSCRAGTSVARVLSWVKPCSASWDLRVECAFLKKKVLLFGCSPRASCFLIQGAGGSCLEITLILRWNVPKHVPGFFVKKNSDIARSDFFLSWVLEVVLSWKSLFGDVRFFEEKSALTECSPRASCYLEQKVGGSWITIVWKNWKSLLRICTLQPPSIYPGSFIQKELGYRVFCHILG